MEATVTLTKADLCKRLVENLDLPRQDADLLVHAFLDSIVNSLRKGEGVELRGYVCAVIATIVIASVPGP